jgi:hypothetical protein
MLWNFQEFIYVGTFYRKIIFSCKIEIKPKKISKELNRLLEKLTSLRTDDFPWVDEIFNLKSLYYLIRFSFFSHKKFMMGDLIRKLFKKGSKLRLVFSLYPFSMEILCLSSRLVTKSITWISSDFYCQRICNGTEKFFFYFTTLKTCEIEK